MGALRPAEWHIGRLRRSLVKTIYGAQAHAVESTLHRKANRKEGVQRSFRSGVIRKYKLNDETLRSPQHGPIWNAAAGGWERERHLMRAAHIVPQAFGKTLVRRLFGDHHHHEDLWGAHNALMLPRGVAEALDDWAVTVVPDVPDAPTEGEARAWAEGEPKEFKFRVLDPDHEMLAEPVGVGPVLRLGRDLDQSPLVFRPGCSFRPDTVYLYFWHTCAVMRMHYGLFRDNSLLSRSRSDRKKAKRLGYKEEPTRQLSMDDFWRYKLKELKRLDENPKAVVDWSLELREENWSTKEEEEEGNMGQVEPALGEADVEEAIRAVEALLDDVGSDEGSHVEQDLEAEVTKD